MLGQDTIPGPAEHPLTPLERLAWPYGWFAERYGWHPLIVDQIPLGQLNQFPIYAGVVDDAKAIRAEQAQAEAEAEAKRLAPGGR
jgi:hypothetical protein